MTSPKRRSSTARNRSRRIRLAALLAVGAAISSCKPPPKSVEKSASAEEKTVTLPVKTVTELASQLAGARIDAAKAKLGQKRPDEALSLLVSALKADPSSEEAMSLAESILRETTWNFPVLTIDHHLPIEQIAVAGPSSLWVSLGGDTNTMVRWNLDSLQIENVLFPVPGCTTRSMVFDPEHQWMVVQRGPVTLLCNARTLKPIRELGPLPDFLTPSAAVAFSRDGLLIAHPGFVSDEDRSIIWHLRDTATGEIIRSSEPAASGPQPFAAYLDRTQLRVLHADGSLLEMPVSPVEETRKIPPQEPVTFLQAQFSSDGSSALTLQARGPHEPPVRSVISYGGEEDGSLTPATLAERFSWSRQPNIWNGLMVGPQPGPFTVEGNSVKILTSPHSPVDASAPVAAVAFEGKQVIVAGENGTLTFHRFLPLPVIVPGEVMPKLPDRDALTDLGKLVEAVTGIRFDEQERTFSQLSADDRVKAAAEFQPGSLGATLPRLDFERVVSEIKTASRRTADPQAFLPLWDRLAHADSTRKSWPGMLRLSEALADTPWHQELTAVVQGAAPAGSPWLASTKIADVFRAGDSAAVLTAIQAAGTKGPAAAAAYAEALKSDRPEWIQASLAQAEDLPPLLRQIGLSRIAWLQGNKAEALSVWPEVFPELTDVRMRDDWNGWEQADFKPALDDIRQRVTDELAAIEVPESSTAEQRKAVAARLSDPATVAAVGRRRFAEACLKAALAFSAFKDETAVTFELASRAREMGAAPEPCLRAEALALTALGDYQKAHPRWIELLTEHPVESTVPGDYAEAAYTAFENSDPRQAMEILTTGMHRFPQDGNFALRAGWVALLTGNSERAYQFLQTGKRIGFPAEKLENATALLTIAAAQSGATDDASVYFQDLLRIDPAWADLGTLDWPEELKAVLAGFTAGGWQNEDIGVLPSR
jgi:tetratricopeptide (TPR) repeat protein